MSGIVLALAGATTGVALPAIGSAYQGGFFAGQISTAANGIADYNLVVGPVASAQNVLKMFRTTNVAGDPTSVIDGPTNSAAMNDANHPAAQFCEGLTVGGFTDWYSPAIRELEVCYYSLKPTTQANDTSAGANIYAVPSRGSNYTSGIPAQTSATNFQAGGAEAFDATSPLQYWSSTQPSTGYTFHGEYVIFDDGSVLSVAKTQIRASRAVRRVAL